MMFDDVNTSIFHGMVVPRRLTSAASSSSAMDLDSLSNEYTVRIQKVYKNGCRSSKSDMKPNLPSLFPLEAYQTITIKTPKNSCGVSSFSMFRSYLFTGVVSYHANPDRALPTTSITSNATMENSSNPQKHAALRRSSVASTTATVVTLSMNVNVCSNYIQPWRTVTRGEKRQLSNWMVNISKFCQ
jgi:hypothetical protein